MPKPSAIGRKPACGRQRNERVWIRGRRGSGVARLAGEFDDSGLRTPWPVVGLRQLTPAYATRLALGVGLFDLRRACVDRFLFTVRFHSSGSTRPRCVPFESHALSDRRRVRLAAVKLRCHNQFGQQARHEQLQTQ